MSGIKCKCVECGSRNFERTKAETFEYHKAIDPSKEKHIAVDIGYKCNDCGEDFGIFLTDLPLLSTKETPCTRSV